MLCPTCNESILFLVDGVHVGCKVKPENRNEYHRAYQLNRRNKSEKARLAYNKYHRENYAKRKLSNEKYVTI